MYEATPLAERQLANFRTVCKAVGRKAPTVYISRHLYERLPRICSGVVRIWQYGHSPLVCCPILQSIVSLAQLKNIPRRGLSLQRLLYEICSQTEAAYNGIPTLYRGSISSVIWRRIHWPSPIGHLKGLQNYCFDGPSLSACFVAQVAVTLLYGSARVQYWAEALVTNTTMAPAADAVLLIKFTKKGENNTRFALPKCGIWRDPSWRAHFHRNIARFGPIPGFSEPVLQAGSDLKANLCRDPVKAMQRAIPTVLLAIGRLCGYTKENLKALHAAPHYLHGSFAAYSKVKASRCRSSANLADG